VASIFSVHSQAALYNIARIVLDGVGDQAKEWSEWTGVAYHIRRRLSAEEQAAVGPAIDLRGTEEAIRRYEACRFVINREAVKLAKEELGPLPPAC